MDHKVESAATYLASCELGGTVGEPVGADGGDGGDASTTNKQPKGKKEEDPLLPEKIVAQVEFYFSDVNLPTDKFMMDKVREGVRAGQRGRSDQ